MPAPSNCPHCGTALPAVRDQFCPECREELPEAAPAADAAVPLSAVPLSPTRPAPEPESAPVAPTPAAPADPPDPDEREEAEATAAPAPGGPPEGTSWGASALIALMLLASVELVNHKPMAAEIGNAKLLGMLVLGWFVVHAIRAFFCSGDRNFGCFGLACVVLAIAVYVHYDEKYFAARRPWNLILVTLLVAGVGVFLAALVLALIRMFEIESERPMGKACLGLLPTGLGLLLPLVWGWRILYRAGSPISGDKKEWHFKMMCVWTAALAVQMGVLGYVWWHLPPGKSLVSPFAEPPLTIHKEAVGRDEQGRTYYQLRVVNTSAEPLSHLTWAVFSGEDWRATDRRKHVPRTPFDLPPGQSYYLPRAYPVGFVFEFECEGHGTMVYELTYSGQP